MLQYVISFSANCIVIKLHVPSNQRKFTAKVDNIKMCSLINYSKRNSLVEELRMENAKIDSEQLENNLKLNQTRYIPDGSSLGFFRDFCKRVLCGGDAEWPLLLRDDGLDKFLLKPCSVLPAIKVSVSRYNCDRPFT